MLCINQVYFIIQCWFDLEIFSITVKEQNLINFGSQIYTEQFVCFNEKIFANQLT